MNATLLCRSGPSLPAAQPDSERRRRRRKRRRPNRPFDRAAEPPRARRRHGRRCRRRGAPSRVPLQGSQGAHEPLDRRALLARPDLLDPNRARPQRGEGKACPFPNVQPVTAAAGVAAARRRGPAVRPGLTAAAVRGGRRYPLVHAAASGPPANSGNDSDHVTTMTTVAMARAISTASATATTAALRSTVAGDRGVDIALWP